MLKTRLLPAVCTVAMLAAVPALAQPTTAPTGAGPTGQSTTESQATPPADSGNTGAPAAEGSHAMHRAARAHRTGGMHAGKSDTSQDAAVDRLNEQSYQAAQKGEAFGGGGSDQGSAGMTKPSGSGDMNTMPGGDTTGQGTKP